MLKKCKNADEYLGRMRPRCCGGAGCVTCWTKRIEAVSARVRDAEKDYDEALENLMQAVKEALKNVAE